MLLSHRTSVKIRPEYSNIIGHMCYAASVTDSAGDLQAVGQGMEIFLCPEKDRRD